MANLSRVNGQWQQWQQGDFEISTDPARLDLDVTHEFLSNEAYWSSGVPRDIVQRAVDASIVFGVYHRTADGWAQVGMARVVSDRATFAWVCDVFVLESFRGHGLGKWLMEAVCSHPDLQNLRRFSLMTRDAHGLYEKFGFTCLADPKRYMEIGRPDIYKRI